MFVDCYGDDDNHNDDGLTLKMLMMMMMAMGIAPMNHQLSEIILPIPRLLRQQNEWIGRVSCFR